MIPVLFCQILWVCAVLSAGKGDPAVYGRPLYYDRLPLGYTAEYGEEPYAPRSYYPLGAAYYEPPRYYYDDLTPELAAREEAREARERALPVGQETWFERDSPRPAVDRANAAFLQNLILSQMAKEVESKNLAPQLDSEPPAELTHQGDFYDERDERDFEDEDVRELKALAGKPLYHVSKTKVAKTAWEEPEEEKPAEAAAERDYYQDYPADEEWINWGSKRSGPRASGTTTPAMPTAAAVVTSGATIKAGQKEVVLPRPATPVRHPFPEPIMKMIKAEAQQTKRSPSVYDTIKRMISLEKDRETQGKAPRKRFVTTDGDLVGELRGLKTRVRT